MTKFTKEELATIDWLFRKLVDEGHAGEDFKDRQEWLDIAKKASDMYDNGDFNS